MSYRITGIDVHKKVLAVVVSDVDVSSGLSGGGLAATPNNRDRWLHGSLSKRSRKWSWNRRPDIGNQFGKRWSGIGSRYARNGKAQAGGRERCI